MKKIAFLTTIFPMKRTYLYDFFNSLKEQTYSYFDIVVVNDGYENFKEFISEFNDLNIVELQYTDTPAKNREFGINYVRENNYDVLIFGDSDDFFDKNRIEISIKFLANIDIVVNDLTLFDEQKRVFLKNYISKRVSDGKEINLEFIKDKNIFGLSNTAINVTILDEVIFDKELIAVDWYLYSILLLQSRRAIFTNKTVTYYRQHENNTIGLGSRTIENTLKSILVKNKHYSLLKKKDDSFLKLYRDNCILKKKIEGRFELKELSEGLENPLWWENINFFEEGNSI